MRLLTFSDLHLGDYRNTPEYDAVKLERLICLARSIRPNLMINVGDTVSLDDYLRDRPDESHEEVSKAGRSRYWKQYTDFKSTLECPVLETCIERERGFFSDLFGLPCEYSVVKAGTGFVSFDPLEGGDHSMTSQQERWLNEEVEKLGGKVVVFMSHVAVAQTTITREVRPGMFLTQSERIKALAEKHTKAAVFLGGHFHVPPESPRQEGRIVMLMAGCFPYDPVEKKTAYLRVIDISGTGIVIRTIDDEEREILPVFTSTI